MIDLDKEAVVGGLAIDVKNRRLFSGCNGNSKMVVMDADNGTVIGTPDIGRGSDGCGFDPAKGLAYSSNGGDGTVRPHRRARAGEAQGRRDGPHPGNRPDDDHRPEDASPLPLGRHPGRAPAPLPPPPEFRRRAVEGAMSRAHS